MKQFGVNFVRLPLGYWNVIDMDGAPDAPPDDAKRMLNLNTIMPNASYYTPYIQKVMDWAAKYGMYVLLDLHGAPGNQNGDSHAGCHVQYPFWDTEWNK